MIKPLPHGLVGRLPGALALVLAFLACNGGPALAAAPVLLDAQGSGVASYGGWTAWSRLEASTGQYALITRSPSGVISAAAVPQRATPFDLELGPTRAGVVAVYSRCAVASTFTGCRIYEYTFGQASQETLAAPGASVYEPGIWDGELVFLRHNPAGGARRPDRLYAWRIGTGRARAERLRVSEGLNSGMGRWPKGETGAVSGLTIHGQQIAYSTVRQDGSFAMTSLWLQRIGGAPRLIDQVTSGAGASCEPKFLSPTFVGPWLYAYLHACEPSANPALDRWTRYSLNGRSAQRARYRFVSTGDEEINAVVPDDSAVDWASESGLHEQRRVRWRTIRRPVPETFCSLAHPVC